MRKKKRNYCPYCRARLIQKKEAGVSRDFCKSCDILFYNNPLPVASSIVVADRKILLVKRKNRPYRNKWCLPSGFAETGETVAEAALRELEEETSVIGRVIGLTHVDSDTNYFYGDLLFLTFEVQTLYGEPKAGDDASAVKYFPLNKIPQLAFNSNRKAVDSYIKGKEDAWAIADSFESTMRQGGAASDRENMLSDALVKLIEENGIRIARLWLQDVIVNPSTPSYNAFDRKKLVNRVLVVTSHFRDWLEGGYGGEDIRHFYMELGAVRRGEGFDLSEVLSAISLVRKHIWEFARSQNMWERTIDIYMILELEVRITQFFDRASFYIAKGYERGGGPGPIPLSS